MSEEVKIRPPCCICGKPSDGTAGFDHWTEKMRVPCCQSCGNSEAFPKWCAESIEMLRLGPIAFPSFGNLARDRKELERALLSESRMKDGVCPNGCARMERYEDGDDHTQRCPSCGFIGWQNTPIEFPYEEAR